MTCKDCLHVEACKNILLKAFPDTNLDKYTIVSVCELFKAKADFVKVVRCRDCAHSRPLCFTEKKLYNDDCVGCTKISISYHSVIMNENDYCSYGEKRSEEE